MQAIILAAGKSSRMGLPYNKCLLPYRGKTLLERNIDLCFKSGVKDICIIYNDEMPQEYLGNVCFNDGNLVAAIKQKEQLGTLHALKEACLWIRDDFMVIMADNWFGNDFAHYIRNFEVNKSCSALVTTKEIDHPEAERFAWVYYVDETDNIKLEEKPHNAPLIEPVFAMDCYCGLLLFRKDCIKYMDDIEPSNRGEYEITEFFNACPPKRYKIELQGAWYDIGDWDSYEELIKNEG